MHDEDRIEHLLQGLEKKLKLIPFVGDTLSYVPVLVAMVRSYINKEYHSMPLGTIIAIISAVAYVVSPVDIIPDFIPGAGYIDDAAVILACVRLVSSDIEEHNRWKEKNKDVDNAEK